MKTKTKQQRKTKQKALKKIKNLPSPRKIKINRSQKPQTKNFSLFLLRLP